MSPDTVPTESIHLKLAWLELNAVGTFTIGTLAVLFLVRWLQRCCFDGEPGRAHATRCDNIDGPNIADGMQ